MTKNRRPARLNSPKRNPTTERMTPPSSKPTVKNCTVPGKSSQQQHWKQDFPTENEVRHSNTTRSN